MHYFLCVNAQDYLKNISISHNKISFHVIRPCMQFYMSYLLMHNTIASYLTMSSLAVMSKLFFCQWYFQTKLTFSHTVCIIRFITTYFTRSALSLSVSLDSCSFPLFFVSFLKKRWRVSFFFRFDEWEIRF